MPIRTSLLGSKQPSVVDQLPDGEHTLGLDGLASAGTRRNPPITVRSGTTANTRSSTVVCSATTASLEIQVTVLSSQDYADGFVAS